MFIRSAFLSIILISFFSNGFAQINFEKGYFVNNKGEKTICFIKNKDWKNNPSDFEYKITKETKPKNAKINDVQEFVIENKVKYIRKIVEIDRSSSITAKLSDTKEPELKKEKLFLKVLVEGKANLYSYNDENLSRFFFKKDTHKIKQLVYKRYTTNIQKMFAEKTYIKENQTYKQQLFFNLKCKVISLNQINKVEYKKKHLVSIFIKYNKCSNSKFVNFEKNSTKLLFNLNIRPGLSISSLSMQNEMYPKNTINFNYSLGYRIGIEAEILLPYNKHKWALTFEPTYQYFKNEKEVEQMSYWSTTSYQTVFVNYKSIEFPIGLRRYFILNNKSKIYTSGVVFIYDYIINSTIDFEVSEDLNIHTKFNFAFGIGYKHKDYSIELRYTTPREILASYILWNSSYKKLSLVFAYSIHK